jgi:hypothetical protein
MSKSIIFLLIFMFILSSCDRGSQQERKLQVRIDTLQQKLNETYKPGFGEFMSGIQTHHAKLWFAGKNRNWPLADFEVNEIKESLDQLQVFAADRPEIKSIPMIMPAIDSITYAINQKDPLLFKNSFILLTNTCNNCHKATEHAFNVVTIPAGLPVVNQDFKPAL